MQRFLYGIIALRKSSTKYESRLLSRSLTIADIHPRICTHLVHSMSLGFYRHYVLEVPAENIQLPSQRILPSTFPSMRTIIHDILLYTGNLSITMSNYSIRQLTSPVADVGRRLPRDPRNHPLPPRIHTPNDTHAHNPPSPTPRTPLIHPSTDSRPQQNLTRQLSG